MISSQQLEKKEWKLVYRRYFTCLFILFFIVCIHNKNKKKSKFSLICSKSISFFLECTLWEVLYLSLEVVQIISTTFHWFEISHSAAPN